MDLYYGSRSPLPFLIQMIVNKSFFSERTYFPIFLIELWIFYRKQTLMCGTCHRMLYLERADSDHLILLMPKNKECTQLQGCQTLSFSDYMLKHFLQIFSFLSWCRVNTLSINHVKEVISSGILQISMSNYSIILKQVAVITLLNNNVKIDTNWSKSNFLVSTNVSWILLPI